MPVVQRTSPAPVAMARHTGCPFGIGLPAAHVARSGQDGVELAADQFFDEPACPIAHFGLDRIKRIVEKLASRLRFTLRGTGLRV